MKNYEKDSTSFLLLFRWSEGTQRICTTVSSIRLRSYRNFGGQVHPDKIHWDFVGALGHRYIPMSYLMLDPYK